MFVTNDFLDAKNDCKSGGPVQWLFINKIFIMVKNE